MKLVTVVIPTFNRATDLERCLGHLRHQTVSNIQVIVVDNQSSDHTQEMVTGLVPAWGGCLDYVRRKPNGPASARNTGLSKTTTPYILFLDSDVDLPAQWIEKALAHIVKSHQLAAVGGYILYAFDPSRVNAYGGDLGKMGLAWDMLEGTALDPSIGPSSRIWINCSAMLARTDAVRAAGCFDETFFYSHEDTDLGWRLNLLGYRVEVQPDLKAEHNVSADSGLANEEIIFHGHKNRLRSILKNASNFRLPVMLAAYGTYLLADIFTRAPRGVKLRALVWNLAHLGDTLMMRNDIQGKRTVSDSQVFAKGTQSWFPPTRLNGRRRRPAAEPSASPAAQPARPIADDRI